MNILIAIIMVFNVFPATSDSLKIQSEIKEVTVYRQQAQIQRTAGLQLKKGKNLVVFEGLSPSLRENSIQLRADKPFTILSLTKRNNYFIIKTESPVVEKLNNQRDSLQKKLNYLNSNLSVLDREIRLLGNAGNMINNQEMSPAELTQLLDLYGSRMADLEKKKLSLNELIKNHQTELDKINAQLREYGGSQRRQFSEVIAEIYSDEKQDIELELEYLVYHAGWNPSYDIRGTDINSPLSISYKANIFQNTAVDWNEVTVTISSANPTLNSTLPEINPVFIGFKELHRTLNHPPQMAEEVVVTGYGKRAKIDSDAELVLNSPIPVQNIQNQTSFSYKIEIPYSVPADGKEHALEFKREKVPAKFVYSSVPKLSEKAYLTGKIVDWNELDFIPGKASIYFENSFIGNTIITPSSFDDSLQVSLGVDESIVIEREKLRDFEERNFFGNRVRENHAWKISVRNNKSETIDINLKDQLPLSRDENIKVESQELSGGTMTKETGIINWNLTLGPGQTKTFRLNYQIEYPKGKKITL